MLPLLGYLISNICWGFLRNNNIASISDYYTPNFEVTNVATKVKSIIDTSDYCDNMTPLENGSFINLVENSNIPYTNPSTYLLIKGIVLDIFSINYTFQYDTNLKAYLSMDDLNNLLSNIEYVIDSLGLVYEILSKGNGRIILSPIVTRCSTSVSFSCGVSTIKDILSHYIQ